MDKVADGEHGVARDQGAGGTELRHGEQQWPEQTQAEPQRRRAQRSGTVLKTADGQLAYPNYVPPAIRPPQEAAMPRALVQGKQNATKGDEAKQDDDNSDEAAQASRQFAGLRRWNTAGLQAPVRTLSRVSPMRRVGTSTSLNRALWVRAHHDEDSGKDLSLSSSSSSEEGEDDDGHDDDDEVGEMERGAGGIEGLEGERRVGATTEAVTGGGEPRAEKKREKHKKLTKKRHQDTDDPFRSFHVGNNNYHTTGRVQRDGRLRITVNETANRGYLAKALEPAVNRVARKPWEASPERSWPPADSAPMPRLNIVIMVIGSRGDAQPFVRIGKVLKEQYGHRVRIATHPAFRDFVERDSGLDFFSVGGDPAELMAFMVKNPGMIPSLETVKAGEIGRRRDSMAEMFEGYWRACVHASDDASDKQNMHLMGDKEPFVADVIIANPPSFAHVHCAEALGVPVHLVFTFPYTPTMAFPHPLASIKKSNVDPGYTNFMSYPLVDMMIWQGLGDLVNNFRVKTLALDPISTLWAPGATYRLHVPFTYLWSPALVPKPQDWGPEIDVAGFVFLDLASSFEPPPELLRFMDAGEPPIYIGFGSIIVDDADSFTAMIFEAVAKAGVRALVSKGWGRLGADNVPENIFMLDNTPHDWLFPRVKACVIHGGAGTTAIALKCARPTMVVPFFGDQHFWGAMIASSRAGPEPIPYKALSADKIADGIKYCLTDEAREAVAEIAKSIGSDGDGAQNAVESFHQQLKLKGSNSMRCSILRDRVAAWQLKHSHLRLSPLAADILVDLGHINWKWLRLLRHNEWNDFEGPGEPVTGIVGSLADTVKDAAMGVGGMPYRLGKTAKKRMQSRLSKRHARKKSLNKDSATADGHNETDEPIAGPGASEYVTDVTASVGSTAWAIAKAPASLALALAQGFHNAPRLYGDDTVRRPTRITGFRSGLVASGREFIHGVSDGVTGVVRLPLYGARTSGFGGFVRGTAMGLGGLVLKPMAAILGPIGFTLQGVVKQVERQRYKRSKQCPRRSIRRARIAQGQRESLAMKQAPERHKLCDEVDKAWRTFVALGDELLKAKGRRGLHKHLKKMVLHTHFMFEDVDLARACLDELQAGKSLDSVVGKYGSNSRHSCHVTKPKRQQATASNHGSSSAQA
ncbi:hypothetical protein CDD82_3181 [Ophiocordyceps australis]|uniref:Uncharacterized protein n=1 Tax=Ophiocordyceps australis TaxID=1399860 RepID=A0A2C5ZE65_9HYPO|nr:hypothetical protein CDD82_3181 [Ophiocordyceps australis]